MSNYHSKAGHIPFRTCVVCKTKSAQKELYAFVCMPAGIVYDINGNLNARKYYHCAHCFEGLPKWRKMMQKKRSRLHVQGR